MTKIQSIRGTHDLYGDKARAHRHVADTAIRAAMRFGFSEIETPIIEPLSVFVRSVGESTDIVSKEMYAFEDRNGESICLRPEGTAPVMRSIIEHKKYNDIPLRLFYMGPMFRYERPQKGRQRQFTQFGVECIGEPSFLADVECIALAAMFLKELGIETRLEINTLGNASSREAYLKTLVSYLKKQEDKLSSDSKVRLLKNPLRILDSKAPEDQEIIKNAPLLEGALDDVSRVFFENVKEGLEGAGISYHLNPHLVRGLDYYSHTAFEFKSSALGAQSTVLAGGRYDDLSSSLGGPALPGIGWGAGIERLVLLSGSLPPLLKPLIIIPIGEENIAVSLSIAMKLRSFGFIVEISAKPTPKAGLKRADKIGASNAIMLGSDEIASGHALVKNLETGEQTHVSLGSLHEHFQGKN